jgi:hypothetical protein
MDYGEPRLTIDIDIVADLKIEHLARVCAAFATPEYYVSEAAVRDASLKRFQFNIIHPASGLKVDVFIPKDTEFARIEAQRIQRIRSEGEYDAWFGSPEDVLLNKLIYFQLGGGSEKHLRDIAGMMKLQREKLDRAYVTTGRRSWELPRNEHWYRSASARLTDEHRLFRERLGRATVDCPVLRTGPAVRQLLV